VTWIATGLAALAMTMGRGLEMLSQAVIANDVKQSMSRALHRRDVAGFREGAEWIATGLRPSR
jgi:ABC-type nickel/cobalt efflux system permease component RcnA